MTESAVVALIEPMNLPASPERDAASARNIGSLAAQLVSITPATRDALNEWLTHRVAPEFRIGDALYQVSWLGSVDVHWHVTIELAVGGYHAVAALDGLAAADPLLVGEPFVLAPKQLRDLAIHRLVARALTGSPQALSQALEVRAIHWGSQTLPDWPCRLAFCASRRPEDVQILGMLLFESADALKWLHRTLPIDKSSARARLALRVPLRLVAGRSTVSPGDLAGLQRGDVVWIESGDLARDGIGIELQAPLARRAWRCRVRRGALRIVAALDAPETTALGQSASIQTTQRGGGFMSAERSQLEAPVIFDLGELNLRIQELEQLQPGQIIELPQDVATATVALRVAGRRLAEGTLIAVGRRLGVRIERTYVAGPHSGPHGASD